MTQNKKIASNIETKLTIIIFKFINKVLFCAEIFIKYHAIKSKCQYLLGNELLC